MNLAECIESDNKMELSKDPEKRRHEDTIQSSVFLAQLDLLWKQFQYVSTVEAGTLVGWYVLEDDHLTAAFLAAGSSAVMLLLLIMIRRHAITLERYRKQLKHVLIPSGYNRLKDQDEKWFGIRLRGHVIARLIVMFLIIVNCLLCLVSVINGFMATLRPSSVFLIVPLAMVIAIIRYVVRGRNFNRLVSVP